MYDLIIIGGGITGFGAAMYAGRLQLKTLVLTEIRGGTLLLIDTVENYPGFKKLTGPKLVKKVEEHAMEYDINVKVQKVIKLEKKKDKFVIITDESKYESKTVLFATGTELRRLNVPGEKEFYGRGIHYCAICDGPLYKNKVVAVVGGSDSAAKEALLLSQWAKKVYIIYRRGELRAEPVNEERVRKNKKIEIIPHTNIVGIKGNKFVTHVILDKPYKGSKEFKLDGVYIEIGRIPISDLAKSIGVRINKNKEMIIDRKSRTNVDGVFAAGDVVDSKYKQAVIGVAEGITAVFSAYDYIKG